MSMSKSQKPSESRPSSSRHRPRPNQRTARELDQLDLIHHFRQTDAKVADALVVVLSCADGKVLSSLGVILDFAAKHAAQGPGR